MLILMTIPLDQKKMTSLLQRNLALVKLLLLQRDLALVKLLLLQRDPALVKLLLLHLDPALVKHLLQPNLFRPEIIHLPAR